MSEPQGPAVSWEEVLAFRLRRHHLDEPADATPADIARRLCGLHAQVASSAELSVAVRSKNRTPIDVRTAVADRTLVKTWQMRGTLHLQPAEDLPLYVAANRTRRGHLAPSWLRYQGVTREQLDAICDAVPRALQGRSLTREELASEVARICGDSGLRERMISGWGDLLKPSAFRGDICFAPNRGRNVTFARPRDLLPGVTWQEPPPDQAMVEVARRFLRAYGPATREDFARWWGGQPAVGKVLNQIDDLATVQLVGQPAFVLRADLGELAGSVGDTLVRLLASFDPYVVAAAPRGHPELVPEGRKEAVYRAQGWISAVLLHRGRMVGVWRHKQRSGRLAITCETFTSLRPKVRRAIADEADRVAGLLGATADLTWI